MIDTGKVIDCKWGSRGEAIVKVQFDNETIEDQLVSVTRQQIVLVRMPSKGVDHTSDTVRPP